MNMMKILGLVTAGVTAVTITVSALNTDSMDKLTRELEVTSGKLTQYSSNETTLVDKYTSLKADAEEKITSANTIIAEKNSEIAELSTKIVSLNDRIAILEADVEANKKEIADLKAEVETLKAKITSLESEIATLKDEKVTLEAALTTANSTIDSANVFIKNSADSLESINNSATPLTQGDLDALSGKVDVELEDGSENKLSATDLNVNFYEGYTHVDFKLTEAIDLSIASKANIVVKFTTADGTTKTKAKHYAGYLNGVDGKKYGKGLNIPQNDYSNDLQPQTYSTTVNDMTNVVKVELIVTNNNGQVTTLEATK